MSLVDWLQVAVFLLAIVLVTKPVGLFLCKVLDPAEATFLDRLLKPVERLIYRVCRVKPLVEQSWQEYLACILGFSFVSVIFVMGLLAAQYYLPLNPQKLSAP